MSRSQSVAFSMRSRFVVAIAVTLAGCAASSKTSRVYEQEAFATDSAFSREFVASPADTCNAARRALLSQGYIVQSNAPDQMNASKRFQPEGDVHVQIEFNVVCTHTARGEPTAVAFVSAVQDRYAVKKTSTSASVGVSPFGSISLPFQSGSDSMVKVASETIPAGRFYTRFFDLVEHFLAEQMGLSEEPAVSGGPVPAPGQAPVLVPDRPGQRLSGRD